MTFASLLQFQVHCMSLECALDEISPLIRRHNMLHSLVHCASLDLIASKLGGTCDAPEASGHDQLRELAAPLQQAPHLALNKSHCCCYVLLCNMALSCPQLFG